MTKVGLEIRIIRKMAVRASLHTDVPLAPSSAQPAEPA